ncbi:MAG: glutaminyl-peptide cyclotransferase [Trueperaceae bacterium]
MNRTGALRGVVRSVAFGVVLACAACAQAPVPELDAQVLQRLPHDGEAFTQGLLWHDGRLFESTGLYGASSVRRVDPDDGRVEAIRWLPDDEFGEGLARVGDQLIQLTWRAGRAYRWPLDGFERGDPPLTVHAYDGEGWGLCHDDDRLIMSDGSDRLFFRNPDDFDLRGSVQVHWDGEPLERLNELACVDGSVWANVWFDDRIVRIDPNDGRVTAWIDLSGLLPAAEREPLGPDAVLNGLAWDPERRVLYATGKLWPAVFALRIEGE